jgi:hypothetical protein
MKKTIPVILLLLVGISALARAVLPWTEAKMLKASDLIVVGTVTKVQDLDETNSTLWPGSKFRGVEATFAVSNVFKGDPATRTVVLHYYRFVTEWGSPPNGPIFLNLTPTDTNQILLYLVRDGASRFAPVSGQVDPSLDAVRIFHSSFQQIQVGMSRSEIYQLLGEPRGGFIEGANVPTEIWVDTNHGKANRLSVMFGADGRAMNVDIDTVTMK